MFVPIVITTLLEHPNMQYVVCIDQDNIYTFFKEMNFSNAILIKYPVKYHIRHYYSFYKIKRNILSQLRKYEITAIYFYHTEFGEFANWLITKYSSCAKIYLSSPYSSLSFAKGLDWQSKKIYLIHRFFFNTRVDVLKTGDYYIPSISSHFYRKNKIIRMTPIINNSIIADLVKEKYSVLKGKEDIVFMTGTVVTDDEVEENVYIEQVNAIVAAVGLNRMLSKCHPRYDNLYGEEKKMRQLPKYLPLNVLLCMYDIYIGYNSTALVEAAVAGKRAISLLDLIPAKKTLKVKEYHLYLDLKLNGKGYIFYPTNINELINAIND